MQSKEKCADDQTEFHNRQLQKLGEMFPPDSAQHLDQQEEKRLNEIEQQEKQQRENL